VQHEAPVVCLIPIALLHQLRTHRGADQDHRGGARRRDAPAVNDPAAKPAGPPRLRTVLCTCGGLYGALVLRRLRACQSLEICAVIRSSRVIEPRFGFLRGAVEQIRRSGVTYALYLWCATTLADWLCSVAGIGAVPPMIMPVIMEI